MSAAAVSTCAAPTMSARRSCKVILEHYSACARLASRRYGGRCHGAGSGRGGRRGHFADRRARRPRAGVRAGASTSGATRSTPPAGCSAGAWSCACWTTARRRCAPGRSTRSSLRRRRSICWWGRTARPLPWWPRRRAERARRVMVNGAGPGRRAARPRPALPIPVRVALRRVRPRRAADGGRRRAAARSSSSRATNPASREAAEALRTAAAAQKLDRERRSRFISRARSTTPFRWPRRARRRRKPGSRFGDVRDAAEMVKTFKRLDYAPPLFFAQGRGASALHRAARPGCRVEPGGGGLRPAPRRHGAQLCPGLHGQVHRAARACRGGRLCRRQRARARRCAPPAPFRRRACARHSPSSQHHDRARRIPRRCRKAARRSARGRRWCRSVLAGRGPARRCCPIRNGTSEPSSNESEPFLSVRAWQRGAPRGEGADPRGRRRHHRPGGLGRHSAKKRRRARASPRPCRGRGAGAATCASTHPRASSAIATWSKRSTARSTAWWCPRSRAPPTCTRSTG